MSAPRPRSNPHRYGRAELLPYAIAVTCSSVSSTEVSRPKIMSMTLTLPASGMTSETWPSKSASGPERPRRIG